MRMITAGVLALMISGCAGGVDHDTADDAACRNAGAKPGTRIYSACRERQSDRRTEYTRRVARSIPLDGYGPPASRF